MTIPNFSASNKPILHVAQMKNNGNPTILGIGYVDARSWQRVTFLLGVGTTDTTVDAKAQESDTGASWSDVPGGAINRIPATGDGSKCEINIDRTAPARKRYFRLLVTVGNGTLGAALAVWAILGLYAPDAVAYVGPEELDQVKP